MDKERMKCLVQDSQAVSVHFPRIMIAAASSEAVSVSIMNLLIRVPAFLRIKGFNKSQRRMLTVKRKIPAYTISIWDFGDICKRIREIALKFTQNAA